MPPIKCDRFGSKGFHIYGIKMKTAILIDGAFFLKRLEEYLIAPAKLTDIGAKKIADYIQSYIQQHISLATQHHLQSLTLHPPHGVLYRTFFYDCSPLEKTNEFYPISKNRFNPSNQPHYKFRLELFDYLRHKPFFALRLGRLEDGDWALGEVATKRLIGGKLLAQDLQDKDFYKTTRQKGMDMKIGLDIAALAYKKLVDQVILIAGDADFVPAVKLARKEGLSVVLDPIGQSIAPDLREHVDLVTVISPDRRPVLT